MFWVGLILFLLSLVAYTPLGTDRRSAAPLLTLLGIVLMVWGSARRSDAKRQERLIRAVEAQRTSSATTPSPAAKRVLSERKGQAPPPGWYADPDPGVAGEGERWWDGTQWTEHRKKPD